MLTVSTYAKNTKCGDNQNITFTPDKELNTVIYGLCFYVMTHRSYSLLKTARLLAHPAVT